MKKLYIAGIGLIVFLQVMCYRLSAQKTIMKQEAPNILFILTDDLGYGDIGIFQNQRGNEGMPYHKTPHLDKMTEQGIVLARHYVPAPVCAPSRASLLRGVHQGHADIRNNQFDKELPDNHNLATVLKEAGYSTVLIGKYGLQGQDGDSPATWKAYPTKRGFDDYFGYVRHRDGHNHYPAHHAPERPPVELYSGTKEISSQLTGCYTTDLFTAKAKNWIVDHKSNNPGKPFFMYLAYDTPHAGLQVASSPYPAGGGLKGGIQWIGEPGNFINTIADTIDTYIHPDYDNPDWPVVQQRFASMVRRIDDGVGDIIQLLKDLKIDEETLIVFTSDNGPHHESYGYGDYTPEFFDSYGKLDGTKRDTWEGGIRVPAIVRWTGKIPAGTVNDTPSGFHDWMPTFAQLANIPAPAITDGVSLLPILTGKGNRPAGNVYIEYFVGGETPAYEAFHKSHKGQKRGEMQVLYLNGYKGIRYNVLSADDDFRIYDTKSDPGEEINLAGSSEFFKDLQKQLKEKVLQIRRPNPTNPRPYDSVPVPGIRMEKNLKKGLYYRLYNVTTPWVPDVSALQQKADREGVLGNLDMSSFDEGDNFVVVFEWKLKIPRSGEYAFNFNTSGNAVMRLHGATIIDADKNYIPGKKISSTAFLEKGLHPVKLIFRHEGNKKPEIQLTWNGSDLSEKMIEDGFFY